MPSGADRYLQIVRSKLLQKCHTFAKGSLYLRAMLMGVSENKWASPAIRAAVEVKMMMFWGNHMGFGVWGLLFSAVIWIGLIALGIWLLARLFPTGGGNHSGRLNRGQQPGRVDRQETALEILQKRYARGELSKEEYETIRHDLTL